MRLIKSNQIKSNHRSFVSMIGRRLPVGVDGERGAFVRSVARSTKMTVKTNTEPFRMKTFVPARELARVRRTRWVDCAFLGANGALSLLSRIECRFSQFPREKIRCPRARTKTFDSIDAATTGRRAFDIRMSRSIVSNVTFLFPSTSAAIAFAR
jgi:hypothetical protein